MSGPFSARQTRDAARRAFNLAGAAVDQAKTLEERIKILETSMNQAEAWLVMFSRLSFYRRLRWLLVGR